MCLIFYWDSTSIWSFPMKNLLLTCSWCLEKANLYLENEPFSLRIFKRGVVGFNLCKLAVLYCNLRKTNWSTRNIKKETPATKLKILFHEYLCHRVCLYLRNITMKIPSLFSRKEGSYLFMMYGSQMQSAFQCQNVGQVFTTVWWKLGEDRPCSKFS